MVPQWRISFLVAVAVAIALRLASPGFAPAPLPELRAPEVIAQWQRLTTIPSQDGQLRAVYGAIPGAKERSTFSLSATYFANTEGEVSRFGPPEQQAAMAVVATPEVEYGHFQRRDEKGDRVVSTACLSPNGAITATAERFARHRRLALTPGRWLAWVMGTQELRDWRCLWITIAFPAAHTPSETAIAQLWQALPPFSAWFLPQAT
jgi:cyanosortase A-associated protein